jgi:uncharacterized protein
VSRPHPATHIRTENESTRGLHGAAVRVLVAAIDLYQRIVSPVLPPSCRFVPSCSQYAQIALRRHGLVRGAWLAVGRLLRCGPWSSGGFDPVPQRGRAGAGSGEHGVRQGAATTV